MLASLVTWKLKHKKMKEKKKKKRKAIEFFKVKGRMKENLQ